MTNETDCIHGNKSHTRCEVDSRPLIATTLPGGHVTYELYEDLGNGKLPLKCVACGRTAGTWAALCTGIPKGSPPDARRLIALVRGIVREAPNDKPNGYGEAALATMLDAHVAMLGEHDGARMIVEVARVKATGDAAYRLNERLADQDRALHFALTEYEAAKGKTYAIHDESEAAR